MGKTGRKQKRRREKQWEIGEKEKKQGESDRGNRGKKRNGEIFPLITKKKDREREGNDEDLRKFLTFWFFNGILSKNKTISLKIKTGWPNHPKQLKPLKTHQKSTHFYQNLSKILKIRPTFFSLSPLELTSAPAK